MTRFRSRPGQVARVVGTGGTEQSTLPDRHRGVRAGTPARARRRRPSGAPRSRRRPKRGSHSTARDHHRDGRAAAHAPITTVVSSRQLSPQAQELLRKALRGGSLYLARRYMPPRLLRGATTTARVVPCRRPTRTSPTGSASTRSRPGRPEPRNTRPMLASRSSTQFVPAAVWSGLRTGEMRTRYAETRTAP